MPTDSPTTTPGSIYLYGKPGCHLCDEARATLGALLAERAGAGAAVPAIVERDIESNADWQRAHYLTIPVLELGPLRLDLATSPAKIRAFLGEALDGVTAAPDHRLSC